MKFLIAEAKVLFRIRSGVQNLNGIEKYGRSYK